MSRLTRDGTAEPVSRDQILRHARGQGDIIFPVQLTTSRIGNLTRLIQTLLYVMTIHTYIHIYVFFLLPPEFSPRFRYMCVHPPSSLCRANNKRELTSVYEVAINSNAKNPLRSKPGATGATAKRPPNVTGGTTALALTEGT